MTASANTVSATAPAFRIRPARRGDTDAMASLLAELGYPGAGDVTTVHWVMSHPEIQILIAADPQDRPVGMVSLSHRPQLRMKGRIVTIDELVVAAAWRRRGVGRALLAKAIERARSLSCKRVELVTHGVDSEPTQAFLKACGFELAPQRVLRHKELDFQR